MSRGVTTVRDDRPSTRPTGRGLTFGLVQLLILCVVLTVPLSYAWRYRQAVRLGLQHQTSASGRTFPRLPPSDVLQVLTFHDVIRNPKSPYAVTPRQFADTMQMLVDAGYTTATAADVRGMLAGRRVSGRKVLVTFDDGARGIWTYADPVLKRLRLHAMAFIITGRVGTHQPYYVTWPQLRAMAHSGRWDLESHTDAAHTDVPVSPYGGTGPALVNLRWLEPAGRMETLGEYRSRIAADLHAADRAFATHGLPAPTMFAYPFSATGHPANDPRIPAVLLDVVRQAYRVAFSDESGAGAITPRLLASRLLPRIEVLSTTTTDELYGYLRRSSPAAPGRARLDDPGNWSDTSGRPDVTTSAGQLRLTAEHPTAWRYALFGPSCAAPWPRYHLSVTVRGLRPHNAAGAVLVRASTTQGLRIAVTDSQLRVRTLGQGSRELVRRILPRAPQHSLTVSETPSGTTVTVDSRVSVTLTAPAGLPAGGIGLGALTSGPAAHGPVFDALTVTAVP